MIYSHSSNRISCEKVPCGNFPLFLFLLQPYSSRQPLTSSLFTHPRDFLCIEKSSADTCSFLFIFLMALMEYHPLCLTLSLRHNQKMPVAMSISEGSGQFYANGIYLFFLREWLSLSKCYFIGQEEQILGILFLGIS